MIDEREDDTPEWEIEDEKIPPSLEQKWKKKEVAGVRAGVCECGYPFTEDELSCKHCGAPIELTEGALISLKNWFFKTPLGIMTLIMIVGALIAFLLMI